MNILVQPLQMHFVNKTFANVSQLSRAYLVIVLAFHTEFALWNCMLKQHSHNPALNMSFSLWNDPAKDRREQFRRIV